MLTGGSVAWGKAESGRGCWAEPVFLLRSQRKRPPPKANSAAIRITIPEEPEEGASAPLEELAVVFAVSPEVEALLGDDLDWAGTAAGSLEAGDRGCFLGWVRVVLSPRSSVSEGEADLFSANCMAL